MEANEAQELQEHAEHGSHDNSMRPVAFTMSLLAVLVAITTVLGHRTHTEAVLMQNKVTDQWNFYQAKKNRGYTADTAHKLLEDLQVANKEKAGKDAESFAKYAEKQNDDLKEEQEKAEGLEKRVELAEQRARFYDFGEALLEIGLVITSVTLLTRKRLYWFFGLTFAVIGIVSVAIGLNFEALAHLLPKIFLE
jgi:hypothetical protein